MKLETNQKLRPQMIITIDRGNTNCKVALFDEGKLQDVISYDDFIQNEELKKSNGAYSCVGQALELPNQLIRPLDYRETSSFLEMPVHYTETLGEDRLICAYHVFKNEHPSRTSFKRSLIIDAGTYLTIDCVSKIGFEGGFIFPGLQVYLNSYEWGAALPRLEESEISSGDVNLPGNTSDAISQSAKVYLESILEKMLSLYEPSKVYLTGGNSKRVAELLENKAELVLEPNLIHKSLYTFYTELNPTT